MMLQDQPYLALLDCDGRLIGGLSVNETQSVQLQVMEEAYQKQLERLRATVIRAPIPLEDEGRRYVRPGDEGFLEAVAQRIQGIYWHDRQIKAIVWKDRPPEHAEH